MKYLFLVLALTCACQQEKPISRSQKSIQWFEGVCASYGKDTRCINITDGDKHELSCFCE